MVLIIWRFFFFIAEWCLCRPTVFSASYPTPPGRGTGVYKELGGCTARTAEPNGPKGYSGPYDIRLSL